MNSKIIAGIVVVVVILGGVVLLLSKSNQPAAGNTPQPTVASQTQNSPTSSAPTAGKNTVTIQNFSFSPATLTVKAGDKVTWTNQDSAGHSATADDGSFDTGVLPQGQSKTITFSKPGTYTYHCSVHPNMKATVTVQ